MPKKKPQNPRFTERDGQILEAIYSHDGVLADYQIHALFFGKDRRTMQLRMELLLKQGYVARPDPRQRAQLDRYTVYWLDSAGAAYIASRNHIPVAALRWRKPGARWSLTSHDVEINNFRIAMSACVRAHPELTLSEWIPSSEFWARPDRINYSMPGGNNEQRGVRPDSFFVIQQPGERPSRFLLEIDRATEDHPRFARDKLHAGIAYIKSGEYKRRFGFNAGRWLVVTTGEIRMRNMQEVAVRELGGAAAAFYFTTQDKVWQFTRETKTIAYFDVLNRPVWYVGGAEQPSHLFESYHRKSS